MSKFETYTDTNGEYRWRLVADNGETVADSAEGYHNRADCMNGLQNFRSAFERDTARQHTVELYKDAAGEFRWRYVHDNGNVIADSGEGYVGRYEAKRGILTALFHATDPETEITE